MPKKKFEDAPYDPIAQDLAREVAATGRTPPMHFGVVDAIGSASSEVRLESPRTPPVKPIRLPRRVPTTLKLPEPPPPRDATITKRFVMSRDEDDALNEFLLRLQKRVGTKVPLSVLVRAAVTVAMQSEDALLDEIREWPIRFPSTHDTLGLGAFEAEWIRCLTVAIRRIPRDAPAPPRKIF